jgi:large subunit ribosomal protein L6
MSRLGKKLVAIPKDVKVEVKDGVVYVEGPKGKLTRKLVDRISIEIKDGTLLVKRAANTKSINPCMDYFVR